MNRKLVNALSPLLLLTLTGITLAGCHRAGSAGADEKPAAEDKGDAKDAKEPEKGEAELPTVSAATAYIGPIEQTLPASGVLMALRDRQTALSAPVAGVLDALPVRFGQPVAAGQIVAHLSTRTLQGQIDQAHASIGQYTVQVQQAEASALQQKGQTNSAILQADAAVSGATATLRSGEATLTGNEAALANVQQSLTRTQALFADGLVAKKDVEAAELAVRSAEAQVAAQRQTVAAQRDTVAGLQRAADAARTGRIQDIVKQKDIAIARQQLENARGALRTTEAQASLYTLSAPLSGTVTSVNAAVGETVDTTTKILTIADLDRLQLQVAVPTASATAVHVGQAVTFTVDVLPGRTFRATIRTVGTQVDPANGTITAIADVVNRGHLLKDALTARVGIVTALHAHSVLVPRAAVLYEAGQGATAASVFVLDKDKAVHKVSVRTGVTQDDLVEILSGVRPGDRVVTVGAVGLTDGTKVQVEGEEPEAKAPEGKKEEAK
jgi:RND family efflux transporter MFP subunit